MANKNLTAAKRAKNDEFYTQLSDVENELQHYKAHFKDKVVYCNCDDPRESSFFKHFALKFKEYGLKKLITTGYKPDGLGVKYTYEGSEGNVPDPKDIVVEYMEGGGDFRSEECVKLLQEADIVVTNPPFSLMREYVAQLMEYNKKFLIIGDSNAITYKEIFPLIKNNQVWYGVTMYGCQQSVFVVPVSRVDTNTRERLCDGKMQYSTIVNTATWFTNLEHHKRHESLDLYKKYNEDEFPHYDNYDAINVNKVSDIPMDYDGVMGVPISFVGKYCPEQFEIVDAREVALNDRQRNKNTYLIKDADASINGKATYARICIRKKQ